MNPEDLLRPAPAPAAKPDKLTLGCRILDRLLGGGIPCDSITEIVAESGIGKTQLSLQLLLSAQLPVPQGGLAGASLYLHSEFPFPLRRLRQLCLVYKPQLPHDPLDKIFVEPLYSADDLLDVLPRLDLMIPKLNIKIIVIDSIAALFRGEFENTPLELKRRSCAFFKISSKLRYLGHKFGLPVVITNQVVDVFESGIISSSNSMCYLSSGRRVSAALGLSWANCVNTRLFMWRQFAEAEMESVKTRRFIGVTFAPHLPNSSVEFQIRREGFFGIEQMSIGSNE